MRGVAGKEGGEGEGDEKEEDPHRGLTWAQLAQHKLKTWRMEGTRCLRTFDKRWIVAGTGYGYQNVDECEFKRVRFSHSLMHILPRTCIRFIYSHTHSLTLFRTNGGGIHKHPHMYVHTYTHTLPPNIYKSMLLVDHKDASAVRSALNCPASTPTLSILSLDDPMIDPFTSPPSREPSRPWGTHAERKQRRTVVWRLLLLDLEVTAPEMRGSSDWQRAITMIE